VEILGLLVVVIIIGALLGGDSLGETIRGGCGCILFLIVAAVVGVALLAQGA
jgi:hypothetical protein